MARTTDAKPATESHAVSTERKPLEELSEAEAADYVPIERTVYETEELKTRSFLEKAPEGAVGYRVISEWWGSFKVEYYDKKR